MDRREMLKQVPAALAAMGLTGEGAKAETVEPTSQPLFLKVLVPHVINREVRDAIQNEIGKRIGNKIPVIVFSNGMDAEIVSVSGKHEQEVIRNQQEAIYLLERINESLIGLNVMKFG